MENASRINEPIEIENAQADIEAIKRFSDELEELSTAVESLLFASPVPLSESQLARLTGIDKSRILMVIDKLNSNYQEWKRAFRIEKYGEGYRFYTLPQYDIYISRLAEVPRPSRLSRAALEVLSIVAYRQPVVKSEIEKIRGIDSDGVIRTLLERGLIEIGGKSDAPGRPLLYRTTPDFLEFFGISALDQLPPPETESIDKGSFKSLTIVRPPESPGRDIIDAVE